MLRTWSQPGREGSVVIVMIGVGGAALAVLAFVFGWHTRKQVTRWCSVCGNTLTCAACGSRRAGYVPTGRAVVRSGRWRG